MDWEREGAEGHSRVILAMAPCRLHPRNLHVPKAALGEAVECSFGVETEALLRYHRQPGRA